jgi:perosamine synthetase
MDKKWTSGNELKYLKEVLENKHKHNPFGDRLEREFSKKYGMKYAIALNSGTSGIHAALHAFGIKPGDEVITTPFTVFVDSSIPLYMKAKIKFADIDYHTHNINPDSVNNLITNKTKAIIPVSYHGLPYNVDAIMEIANENDIYVLGDHAQSHMAKYKGNLVGTQEHISMFSLERTKHVSCGEGGILLTNDDILAESARKFAGMGFKNLKAGTNEMAAITPLSFQDPEYKRNDALGLNYRLPEFCSAVALAQLERIDEKIKLCRDIGKLYDSMFKSHIEFNPQTIPPGYVSSYFTYATKTNYNIDTWRKFHKFVIDNGGDDFYAGMSLVFEEEYMMKHKYNSYWIKKCPIAKKVQKGLMQFKTNYRTIEEAKYNIDKLGEIIVKWKD